MPDYCKLHLSGFPTATSSNAVWSALAALPGFPDVLGVRVFSTNTATVSTAIITLGGPLAAAVAVAWSVRRGPSAISVCGLLRICTSALSIHTKTHTTNIVTYSSLSEHSHLWFAFPSQNTPETFKIVFHSSLSEHSHLWFALPSHTPETFTIVFHSSLS